MSEETSKNITTDDEPTVVIGDIDDTADIEIKSIPMDTSMLVDVPKVNVPGIDDAVTNGNKELASDQTAIDSNDDNETVVLDPVNTDVTVPDEYSTVSSEESENNPNTDVTTIETNVTSTDESATGTVIADNDASSEETDDAVGNDDNGSSIRSASDGHDDGTDDVVDSVDQTGASGDNGNDAPTVMMPVNDAQPTIDFSQYGYGESPSLSALVERTSVIAGSPEGNTSELEKTMPQPVDGPKHAQRSASSSPVNPSEVTGDYDSADYDDDTADHKPHDWSKLFSFFKGLGIFIIVACIVSGVSYAGLRLWDNHTKASALAACQAEKPKVDDAFDEYSKASLKAQDVSNYDPNDVADVSTLSYLKQLTTSYDSTMKHTTDEYKCDSNMSIDDMNAITHEMTARVSDLTRKADRLNSAVKAVEKSKSEKALTDAEGALDEEISNARTKLSEANGLVEDESTLTALADAISASNSFRNDNDKMSDADAIQRQVALLKQAEDAVDSSIKAKEDADKKAEEAAADKTRCSAIAGTYGMWQGSASMTLDTACNIVMNPNNGEKSTSASFKSGTWNRGSDGTASWSMTDDSDVAYYPAGVQSPILKKYFDGASIFSKDPTVNYPKIEWNGLAFVGDL